MPNKTKTEMQNTITCVTLPANVDFNHQANIIPGSKRPGQTGAYCHAIFNPGVGHLPGKVLPDMFASGLSKGANRPFLGHRPVVSESPLVLGKEYVWQTYGQIDKRRRLVGSALEFKHKSGMYKAGEEFETVGIWSINRPEWQIIDLACQAYNKVSVSLYDSLGPDACEYIINHAEVPIIFATQQHVSTLLGLAKNTPTVKTIVSIDKLDYHTKKVLIAWGKEHGIEIMDFAEFEALGEKHLIAPLPVTPDTIASICYTSGTTSKPKGVVLSHGNLTSATLSNLHGCNFPDTGVVMSYLPLAHIYERFMEISAMALSGQIGYFSGDPLRLMEDAQILRPTMFPSVPRVTNRIYLAALQAGKAPGLKGALFRKAMETKLHNLRATGENKHMLWDRLVFSKIQGALGGRIETIASGSAPISRDCMDFLKVAFACDVIEGYGMTETCATAAIGWVGDPTSTGKIGGPQMVNSIKLVDVPAMNYTSDDVPHPRGEICIKGPNVFKRYFKDEKNTKEALDDEGWLHTGDIGEVDPQGRFKIIDRLKNIMKLAQGEYVALEKIENVYSACHLVAQIYVHDHLVAVVVADPVNLGGLLKHDPTDLEGLSKRVKEPEVIKKVLQSMTKTAHEAGLKGFEHAKSIHVTMEPFTIENGILTPTFKVKRRDAAEIYKDVLVGLYPRT
ncbi:hypothetical protein FRB96_007551 [Tulasnella sp. 330]|nr:hypothetical protein FRB96_007551 [Tulasnella sp. 330]KAG8882027.1 hypothetical protein FRB97_008801 [Tulasnella sp. 331]KAG8887971.1 hypothetical protein FRB98_008644 [Tulasnella sp. 332]